MPKPKYIESPEFGTLIRCVAGVPHGKSLPCPWIGRDQGCKPDANGKPLCPWCGGKTQKIEQIESDVDMQIKAIR